MHQVHSIQVGRRTHVSDESDRARVTAGLANGVEAEQSGSAQAVSQAPSLAERGQGY
jgi:hypothetical protein